ncbi:hypothetical protein MCW82_07190 [Azospirillum doebereinerae]|uniref:hypothetical protein n=1 Tax=Azospirillum doebereinerae TaxID=92933 RepID=UPI001EE580E0|nr:hypothetical protein [Azospirillum doebereinerae]MCG5239552.1 hypothetical protein [Azospirillum doebereinerae]
MPPAGRGLALLLACLGLAGWLLWVAVLRPAVVGFGHGGSIRTQSTPVLFNHQASFGP